MGLEDENGPPKKKLKQAQLSFGNVALKSQKRKLSTELNDDVHLNKIVCKETEKENVEVNNTSLVGLSDKWSKSELDSVCKSISEKHNTSTSESNPIEIVDLSSSDTASVISGKDVEPAGSEVKEDEKSLRDFSLVISDSLIDTINNKSSIVKNEKNETNDNSVVEENCSSIYSSNADFVLKSKELEHNMVGKDLSKTNHSLSDEDLNRTLNSEDDDLCISSEESPKNKTSPNTANRKLTPKRLESLKKKDERERLRLERKALKEKVKEEKLKLKQEKEDMKRKEKEDKERKRQAELKMKEEEKRLKEEEKKKKEEEKRLKEEEKRLKEEEKRRKEGAKEEEKRKKEEMNEKEKAAFVNFFISKKKQLSDSSEKLKENEEIKFMPFPMKSDMRLATEPRWNINSDVKRILDSALLNTQENDQYLYLKELKTGVHLPQKTDATWPVISQEEDHDVIIIESTANGDCIDLTNSKVVNNKNKMKAKLLQFHDNRRPPYWGTWRKKSYALGPRKPFGQDKEIFSYEADSDSEWEDEGEGEDIDKEGDSDEEQCEEEDNAGENGYILDNTFVPHGYLSDEEVHPDEDVDDNNPENLKLRMKLLKQEFDEEMKSKTERLKPRLLGCVWISNGTTEVSIGSLYETLMRFRAVWNEDGGPIDLSGPEIEESPTSMIQIKTKSFPKTVIPVLAKFVHESYLPLSALVKEFLLLLEKEYPSESVTKRAVTTKIKEIASKTFDVSGKSVWAINLDLCKKYGLKSINLNSAIPSSPQTVEKPKESLLVNFLKGTHTPQPAKKRVPLIPVTADDCTPVKNENERTKYVSTPRPTAETVLKKRAQLITLSRTPTNSSTSAIHKDTPRPSHVTSSIETVDLSADSP